MWKIITCVVVSFTVSTICGLIAGDEAAALMKGDDVPDVDVDIEVETAE